MNHSDLVDAVAKDTDLTKVKVAEAVDAVFSAIGKSLAKGMEVRLVGFGSFAISKRAARTGRNPQTGATIKIAASKAVRFKAGKNLKDAVNKK
jgi:DNA-binding protein HU-beta